MLLPSSVVRRLIPMVALLAACGGATGVSADSTDSAVTTEIAVGTDAVESGQGTTTTQGTNETSTTSSGRPVAPDFTLELSDGGSYTLSDAERPVYLVFWAEW